MKNRQRFVVYALRHDPDALGVWLVRRVDPRYVSGRSRFAGEANR